MAHDVTGGGAPRRKLTVLIWLASDTGIITGDLREAMKADLVEIWKVKPTAEMSFAVAFDNGNGDAIWQSAVDNYAEAVPTGGNMASLANLISFIDWAIERCPAESYALIVGGHGSGIARDTETYRFPTFVSREMREKGFKMEDMVRVDPVADTNKETYHTVRVSDPIGCGLANIYETKARLVDGKWQGKNGEDLCGYGNSVIPVDLAYDDGSRQAMSIADLGMAARHLASKGPLACILLDCCYMASVEVAAELKGAASTMVASPEPIPAEGQDYTKLLQTWQEMARQMATEGCASDTHIWARWLAVSAVTEFQYKYQNAQSNPRTRILALDLTRMQALLDAMDEVAADVMIEPMSRDTLPELTDYQRTEDPRMAYLSSWLLALPYTDAELDNKVETALALLGPAGVVISEWSADGEGHGPAVYLPEGPVEGWYNDLSISKRPFGQMIRWAAGG